VRTSGKKINEVSIFTQTREVTACGENYKTKSFVFLLLPNIFIVIKSKTACSTHVEDKTIDKILVGKSEKRKSFWRTRRSRNDNIKIFLSKNKV
jgi:hypothetical protein